MSAAIQRPRNLKDVLNAGMEFDVADERMEVWDKGVFLNELHRQKIVLSTDGKGDTDGTIAAETRLKQGTYHGTRLALTGIYNLIAEANTSQFDTHGWDPIIPTQRSLQQKQETYQWSDPAVDGYPPHLKTVPPLPPNQDPKVIFNAAEVENVKAIASAFSFIIPTDIPHEGTPYKGPTIADCEAYNLANPSPNTDIMGGENIGYKEDWYSDARFAQQHLSGVNPTTIEKAPADKVKAYVDEANKQGLGAMKALLSNGKDLFIQDYSYFREATGVKTEETFENTIYELDSKFQPTGKKVSRYACASVILFQLHSDGRLHPLVITLDYRGSLDKSVTIFNRRLTPDDKGDIAEKDDWPWRYAKTCAQTADWARHEIAVHLVDTHLIEEAIIVATNRTVPENHLLYEVLNPHWFRTLPLNAAARDTLIPFVIARIAGFGPTSAAATSRTLGLVNWSYKNFNFQEKYIPNDLKKRGFDLEAEKGDKYRNSPYATNMHILWAVIRDFVKSVLATKYKCDHDVRADKVIPAWCKEIQEKGQIKTFPTITTLDQLIDAVTMCIHIASPQHTAVNYLQDYYYSFVPSKPPALCTALPTDLKTLQGYTEQHLTEALPIGTEGPKWKDWLLAAQLPELLSYKVEEQYNLMTYAKSLYNVNKNRTNFENKEFDFKSIKKAAAVLFNRLKILEKVFIDVSDRQIKGTIEYKVLQPELTAISILI
ncbi:lipoxygenase [Thelonectria olida]|uniref:Manganese lipoxygenase n=1 Tax=Thelonectria olida TaxID=1576542 RepID=A0A9P8VUA5_9HYPO|nr:lipoxygenase [Thelonectria olida]